MLWASKTKFHKCAAASQKTCELDRRNSCDSLSDFEEDEEEMILPSVLRDEDRRKRRKERTWGAPEEMCLCWLQWNVSLSFSHPEHHLPILMLLLILDHPSSALLFFVSVFPLLASLPPSFLLLSRPPFCLPHLSCFSLLTSFSLFFLFFSFYCSSTSLLLYISTLFFVSLSFPSCSFSVPFSVDENIPLFLSLSLFLMSLFPSVSRLWSRVADAVCLPSTLAWPPHSLSSVSCSLRPRHQLPSLSNRRCLYSSWTCFFMLHRCRIIFKAKKKLLAAQS